MCRTMLCTIAVLAVAGPRPVQAQEAPPEAPPVSVAAESGAPVIAAEGDAPVIVEAGTPVPVPLEGVAERLRVELPSVPVQVGGGVGVSAGARVTLLLLADGQMLVVYRDSAGREASRIVADTHDPQAVAAAVAMIVGNLHRSQVDLALAAIGPALVASPPVPPPPVVEAAPPPIVEPGPARPVTRRARLVARASRTVEASSEALWAVTLSPTMDLMPANPIYGLQAGVERAFGPFRGELSLETTAPMSMFTYDHEGNTTDGQYSHTVGLVRARRMLPVGSWLTLGAAAGIGFVISVTEDVHTYPADYPLTPDTNWGGRSDLDFVFTAGASADVRLLGQTLYWTTRIDGMLTTSSESTFRPFGPGNFGHVDTGLRLAI